MEEECEVLMQGPVPSRHLSLTRRFPPDFAEVRLALGPTFT